MFDDPQKTLRLPDILCLELSHTQIVIMDPAPSPPQHLQPAVDGSNEPKAVREEKLRDHGEEWVRFLKHHIRDVVLCEYHNSRVWIQMSDRREQEFAALAKTKEGSEEDALPAKCYLCNLFGDQPFIESLSVMKFGLRPCRMTVGSTAWQSYVEISPRYPFYLSNGLMFRLEFPGSESIRGQTPRRRSATRIDYGLLFTWFNKCRQEHQAAYCWPEAKSILGMKLIDCHTRRVVDAEHGCQYVTLSYVWGDATASGDTPGSYTPTIEDAITVADALGFRYLWVDRYVRTICGCHNNDT
jgi:hypothetical protein